jgi:hypothetical protein
MLLARMGVMQAVNRHHVRKEHPIVLPDGRKLRTVAEAIAWLAKEIPKSEHGMKEVLLVIAVAA